MCLQYLVIELKVISVLLLVGVVWAEPTHARSKNRTDLYGDPLPSRALARVGTVRLRHGECVNCVVFSPDGKTVVAGSWDGAVRSWDGATGKQVHFFNGHESSAMAFSFKDGKTFASIGQDNIIRLWDLKSGKEVTKLDAARGGYYDVSFSPDHRLMVACGGNVSIWEKKNYRRIKEIELGKGWIYSIAFSPDGKIMVSGDQSDTIRFWDTAKWQELRRVQAHQQGVRRLAFSPDGKYLASSGYRNGILVLRDAATGKEIRRLSNEPKGGECGIAFSPDSKTLAWSSDHDTIRLFDVAAGKEIRQFKGHQRWVEDVAFSPDGKTLASAGADCTVRLWDVATGKQRLPSGTPSLPVANLALSVDGAILVTTGWWGQIQCWDTGTGKLLREMALPNKEQGWVNHLSFSPDGETLYVLESNAAVSGWDILKGRQTRRLRLQGNSFPIALSPDGKTVVTASWQNAEPDRLYDLATGKEISRCDQAFNVAFVPGGRFLVMNRAGRGGAGGAGGAGGGANGGNGGNGGNALSGGLALWDLKEGKIVRSFPQDRQSSLSNSCSLIVSPDGETLLAGTDEHGVLRWDIATGEPLPSLNGRQKSISSLALSADGRTLASGGRDGTIHLGEIKPGQHRGLLQGHRGAVLALDFSRDCRRLASGSKDTTALIWDLTDGLAAAPKMDITPKQLAELWKSLAGDDAVNAYQSIWRLAAAAKQTVPFLQMQLRPVPVVDDKRIARLIADLDSDEFAVRSKASGELQKLGEIAASALRATAAKPTSPEVRRLVDALLNKVKQEKRKPSPERIRLVRAVEVLERIGTAEARELLRKLAGGAASAQLTREAKASLTRLARRAVAKP